MEGRTKNLHGRDVGGRQARVAPVQLSGVAGGSERTAGAGRTAGRHGTNAGSGGSGRESGADYFYSHLGSDGGCVDLGAGAVVDDHTAAIMLLRWDSPSAAK